MNIACDGGNIALINGKLEKCRGVCDKCDFCDNDIRNAGRCREKAKEWANSQYIDWSEVPVDTPILVRDSELLRGAKNILQNMKMKRFIHGITENVMEHI